MNCLDNLPEKVKTQLIKSLYLKNLFYFIGSGFSNNFGYPDWDTILKEIKTRVSYEPELDLTTQLRAAEILCSHAVNNKILESEAEFNELVANTLKDKQVADKTPDWIEDFKKLSPSTIITTNWDNVLEKIYEDMPNVIVRKDQSPEISNKTKNIFKIHGDVGRPQTLVFTQSQYHKFQREETYLNRKVFTLFSELTPVLIGYGLNDPNIVYLYEEVFANFGKSKSPVFMVIKPGDKKIDETRLIFEKKHIYIIEAEVGEFLSACNDEIKTFQAGKEKFWTDYSEIKEKIEEIITLACTKNNISEAKLQTIITGDESATKTCKALIKLLENPQLSNELQKHLLSPRPLIKPTIAHNFFQVIIKLSNIYELQLSRNTKFISIVIEHAIKSPKTWDFNHAKNPFIDILSIHPPKSSSLFNEKVKHIREVLQWSAPFGISGKCWATWKVFQSYNKWLTKNELNALIDLVIEDSKKYRISTNDTRWIDELKEHPEIVEDDILKDKYDNYIPF